MIHEPEQLLLGVHAHDHRLVHEQAVRAVERLADGGGLCGIDSTLACTAGRLDGIGGTGAGGTLGTANEQLAGDGAEELHGGLGLVEFKVLQFGLLARRGGGK
ncbi:MAG: hypothetical protein BWX86_02117 [Verrucomicrobia bacterium ADurb.Bin122]|nr:MAG: hypothetical protein BWX86_02117 [Verrucomicrobia bacterium ADurb.Bin122]